MPEKSARKPVQRLAWRLLAEAESYPPLIHRSENSSEVTNRRSKRSFPAIALLSDPSLDIRQYLENLVTIAVGSAQQAEDMLFEVRKANKKARRRMAVVASFGALGTVVGIAGFIASSGTNVSLTELRTEVSALANIAQDIASLQQRRKTEVAALASQEAAREDLQHQIADLQQQAISLRDEVARGSKVEPARAGTERLLQDTDPLQQQRQTELPTSARRKSRGQQLAALPARRPPASPLNLTSTPVQPIPVLMPEPSATQQLLIAQQWLATGRLDQARHVLAMVQTRMVLQPVDLDQPAAQRAGALTDVGNVIRLLDTGSTGQAMQALNRAMTTAGAQ